MKDNLRAAMGRFATGITIVTTRKDDEINGMTANAVASVSLEPPQILVCIDRDNYSAKLISESRVFALNILAADQQELSDAFARPGAGKSKYLNIIPTTEAVTGSPIIEGCLAYLDCTLANTYQSGDHIIFIGKVEKAEVKSEANPLIYWNSSYHQIR